MKSRPGESIEIADVIVMENTPVSFAVQVAMSSMTASDFHLRGASRPARSRLTRLLMHAHLEAVLPVFDEVRGAHPDFFEPERKSSRRAARRSPDDRNLDVA
jgi:hypothetical protein